MTRKLETNASNIMKPEHHLYVMFHEWCYPETPRKKLAKKFLKEHPYLVENSEDFSGQAIDNL